MLQPVLQQSVPQQFGEHPENDDLPAYLQNAHNVESQKTKLNQMIDELPNGYQVIDNCGNHFKKIAPYVNKALTWGWIPICVYFGLKQGTHKYYPNEDMNLPDQSVGTQLERKPSWTDIVPLLGSAGSSQSGLLSSSV